MTGDDTNPLLHLLRADAKVIGARFESASHEGKGTSQEVADFREHAIQEFVSRYFPFPHRIAKGVIRDSDWRRSASVDCVLCNPIHPHLVDSQNKFRLLLADGVDVAVEVKPDISRKDDLEEALEQGLTVKALRRASSLYESRFSPVAPEVKEHATRIPFYVYAMKTKVNAIETIEEMLDFYARKGVPRVDQADGIVVHGNALIMNFKYAGQFDWRPSVNDDPTMVSGKHVGWVLQLWGEDTLAGFLYELLRIIPPVMAMAAPILGRYLHRGLGVTMMNAEELVRRKKAMAAPTPPA